MNTLSVVIGRFQVPSLSPGHLKLLGAASSRAKHTLVLLGTSPLRGSKEDPLEFRLRASMIRDGLTTATILPLPDHPSNREWVKEVDRVIEVVGGGLGGVVLYGGRDSCLTVYKENGGRWPTDEFAEVVGPSGTELREQVGAVNNAQFRAGVVHAQNRAFPRTFPVVDVLIWRRNPATSTGILVLLGRKREDEKGLWRLIGGFVDPTDSCLEFTVKREVREETEVEVGNIVYAGSATVDDWRYRRGKDRIMSSVFTAEYSFGNAKASDDLHDLRWFSSSSLPLINPTHTRLFNLALSSKGLP